MFADVTLRDEIDGIHTHVKHMGGDVSPSKEQRAKLSSVSKLIFKKIENTFNIDVLTPVVGNSNKAKVTKLVGAEAVLHTHMTIEMR